MSQKPWRCQGSRVAGEFRGSARESVRVLTLRKVAVLVLRSGGSRGARIPACLVVVYQSSLLPQSFPAGEIRANDLQSTDSMDFSTSGLLMSSG